MLWLPRRRALIKATRMKEGFTEMAHHRSDRVSRVFKSVLSASLSVLAAMLFLWSSGCGRSPDLGKDVLARVSGDPITVEDVKIFAGSMPHELEEKRDVLSGIIKNRLFAKQAIKEGLMTDMTVVAAIEDYHARVLPAMLKNNVAGGITVTDAELEAYKRPLPTLFFVSYISTDTLDDAEAVRADIDKGVPFDKLADGQTALSKKLTIKEAEVSLDDNFYPFGLRAMLNRLKPGEAGPITKLEVGYYIYRLKSRRESSEQWEQKKVYLRAAVKKDKIEQAMADLTARLRQSADIKMNEGFFDGKGDTSWAAKVNGMILRPLEALANPNDPHGPPHQTLNLNTRRKALENLINGTLLAEEARRRGLQSDPVFQRALRIEVDKALSNAFVEKAAAGIEATPEEIKDYYEKNKARFGGGKAVKMSRILVKKVEDAQAVLRQLNSGKGFVEAAKEYSLDKASSDKGGDLGYITMTGMKDYMFKVVSGMKVGEVRVVKSEYGYEIIKLTDEKMDRPPDVSEIMDTVRKRVILNKRSEIVEGLARDLFNKADVKVNDDLLKSI